jgi:single-stranded DNA-binding protein
LSLQEDIRARIAQLPNPLRALVNALNGDQELILDTDEDQFYLVPAQQVVAQDLIQQAMEQRILLREGLDYRLHLRYDLTAEPLGSSAIRTTITPSLSDMLHAIVRTIAQGGTLEQEDTAFRLCAHDGTTEPVEGRAVAHALEEGIIVPVEGRFALGAGYDHLTFDDDSSAPAELDQFHTTPGVQKLVEALRSGQRLIEQDGGVFLEPDHRKVNRTVVNRALQDGVLVQHDDGYDLTDVLRVWKPRRLPLALNRLSMVGIATGPPQRLWPDKPHKAQVTLVDTGNDDPDHNTYTCLVYHEQADDAERWIEAGTSVFVDGKFAMVRTDDGIIRQVKARRINRPPEPRTYLSFAIIGSIKHDPSFYHIKGRPVIRLILGWRSDGYNNRATVFAYDDVAVKAHRTLLAGDDIFVEGVPNTQHYEQHGQVRYRLRIDAFTVTAALANHLQVHKAILAVKRSSGFAPMLVDELLSDRVVERLQQDKDDDAAAN